MKISTEKKKIKKERDRVCQERRVIILDVSPGKAYLRS